MSLNCRVFRDEKGQIDFVNAPNGNRSKLFDKLVDITGGNKNTALNIYALTETENLKDAVKAKINSFKNRFSSMVRIAPSDIRFSIVGEKGAANLDLLENDTVRIDNLEVAIDMENSGENPQKIKIATGWEKGADGRWKYELDSSKASLNFNIDSINKLGKKYSLKSILKYPELFKAYPELNDVKISISKKGGTTTEGFFDGKDIVLGIESNKLKDFFETKARLEKYKKLDPEVLRIINKSLEIDSYEESLRASGMSYSEATDKALEKYPYEERDEDYKILSNFGYAEIIKSTIPGYDFLAPSRAFMDILRDFKEGSDKALEKSDFNNLNEVLLPVTLHEVQHWIQKKEGFAKGANTVGIYSYLTEEEKNEYKTLTEAKNKAQEDLAKEGKKWYDAPKEVSDVIFAPSNYLYQKYRSAMGEEEARNVEKRLKMTPRERLYSLLQDTEDLARENQIFIPQKDQAVSKKLQPNQREVIDQITDRLKQSGLANNVYQMTNAQIEAKLVELGYSPELAKQVIAYHGSPYSFDKFTTEKMGTGEGVQAFGWGLYFTDLESIARNYADVLGSKPKILYKGKNINDISEFGDIFYYLDPNNSGFIPYYKISQVKKMLDLVEEMANSFLKSNYNKEDVYEQSYEEESKNVLKYISEIKRNLSDLTIQGGRNLYKVSLHKGKTPDQYTWLEWDKPVSNKISKLIEGKIKSDVRVEKKTFRDGSFEFVIINNNSNNTLARITDVKTEKEALEKYQQNFSFKPNQLTGQRLYSDLISELGSGKEASLFLLENGIDGIKYPAESISRGATSDTARGFNYVVFDDSAITIDEKVQFSKNGVNFNTAGFTYKGDVYLNTDAMGLDTPIHEFGHLHLDWLKENRTDLYQAGLSLIDKNKEEAQQYINIVKETQPDLKEGTEKFNNEVLAQVIGDQGARLVNSNKENTLADWLKNVWEAIKNFIGLTDYTAEQVANMTLAEFGTASAAEMLSGSRIQRSMGEDNVYLRYKYDNDQVARERFDIPKLKEISSGSDRIVFDLGDGRVLKVANTARGLAQNMQEGDSQLIEKGLIPQVYETGLNYVVVEKVEEANEDTIIPVYNLNGKKYDTESLGTMIAELEPYNQADFDVKDQNLIDILNSYGLGAMADYDILFGDLLNVNNWGIKEGKLIHLDAGTFGGMYMIRQYARRKDMSFKDFENVYNRSQEAKTKFGDTDTNVNFSVVAGNKLFNEPLEEAATIADEYIKEKGFSTAPIQKITKLNTENSKRIAKEFDKMKPTPNDPETKASYNAMVKETLEQYEKILSKGYKVEINNSEPYNSSADMITDLRENKRMKIFSTESGFGDEAITDNQRRDNPLLQETKYKDANGVPLLANDVFRFVHDFFGHAKLGNGFGAIGEENAWNIHSRMYSPLARRAMTTETRGQNSWVNFSGVNDEAFKKRDRARMLRQEGKIEEAKKLTEEVYQEMSFAEQKIGLLPEWVSMPYPENISSENSSNYANLTEDNQGNFVFYHVGKNGYDVIKRSSGGTLATSKEEAQALAKVGGLAMYYTRPEDGETMVTGDSKYMVKISTDKVYDFNTDSLNLIEKAKELHSKEHPGKAFDPNTQVAYVTKVAGELGYEMVVAQWGNRTRAQSIKELRPTDTQISEGNAVVKPFNENYESNSTKGYISVIPVPKKEQLKQFYLDLNNYRNRDNRYDDVYRIYEEYLKLSQEEIEKRIKNSDLPQEYKNRYDSIIGSEEGKRMSMLPISKSVKREPSLELNGTKIFAKERVNPITGEPAGDIELELIESTERGQGNARKAAELFLNGTDVQGKDVYLTVSPRDAQTSPERLESFYSSLGFKKVSDFEMIRKAKSITPKDIDSNGEISVKALMDFSNSKAKPLGLEGLKAAKNAAMALKVKSSEELIEKMERALMKNGIVLFDKLSLQRSKLYNNFEINTILSSPNLQKQIKDSLLSLKNSEPFSIDYNDKFVVPQGIGVNQFGKQEVLNPNIAEKELIESVAGLLEDEIEEALPAYFSNKYYTDSDFRETVNSIAKDYKKAPIKEIIDGELIDKTEDVSGMLTNTLTDDFNESIAEDIRFLREEIDEDIFNSNLSKVSKVLNKIRKNAYINGIDLRNFPTLALEMSRDQILGFLDSMEDMLAEPYSQEAFDEFSDRYYEMLGEKEPKTEVVKSNSQNDVFIDEPLSEYEMFSKFGLVKKQDNIYRKVVETPLETLYENFFEHKNLLPENVKSVDSLKEYVQKNIGTIEVSDYEVDVDNLEKMFLYKKFFGFPMSTMKTRVSTDNFNKLTNSEEYLTGDFIKEFNKWLLATGNTYFKVTNKGIELTQKDELSKSEAIDSVPVRFKQDLAEYNVISNNLNLDLPLEEEQYRDVNTQYEERQKVVNNPDRVKKITGQYTYLKEGVLAVKNEGDTFVRTPIGVFEKIFESANIKFYGKLDTDTRKGYKKIVAEAPFTNISFSDYMYLENTPEAFKDSKNYYSRKELDDINKEYFECQ